MYKHKIDSPQKAVNMDILHKAIRENLSKLNESQTALAHKQRHLNVVDPKSAELTTINAELSAANHKVKILQDIVSETPQYNDIRLIATEALNALSANLGDTAAAEAEIGKLVTLAENAKVSYVEIVAEIRRLKRKNLNNLSQEEVFAQLMALEHKMCEAQIQQELFIMLSNHLSTELGLEPAFKTENEQSIELDTLDI